MKCQLSVIICTYNRQKYIYGLLRSLENQSIEKSKYEIVFINNNSTDDTETICNEYKNNNPNINFNYFNETNQGLSFARNRGIKESKGNILVFIDDDAIASDKYLEEIYVFFKENDDAFGGGGKILPKYESNKPEWMPKVLEPLVSVIDLGNKLRIFPEHKYPIGANMFFRKEVFVEIGLFNTNLGRTGKNLLGGEEKDVFNKMRKKNMLIYYVPNAWIYHIVPDSRLSMDFIKKQASGIGLSEKIRSKSISKKESIISFFKEFLKWGASIILFVFYALTFRYSKALMIVKFRYWVSKGLFTNVLADE